MNMRALKDLKEGVCSQVEISNSTVVLKLKDKK
jgi:hypothetical protein